MGDTNTQSVAGVSAPNPQTRQPGSSLALPTLFISVAVIAAALGTWAGIEHWYIGAARDFVPRGCEHESCAVQRHDYIHCGSLFDQSALARDPNCQRSLSELRGRVIAGYTIAGIAAAALIWWTYRYRRQRRRYRAAR